MIKLSNKARGIKPSPTLAVMSKAKEYIAKGIDVINFGVGEPDFNTPEYVKNAGIKAIEDNFTRYTPTPGILPLREAVCVKLKRDNNLEYKPSQVLVSPGAKASIVNVLTAICDAGDQVIIPVPYWVSYPDQVKIAGGESLFMDTTIEDGFKINPVNLKSLIEANPNVKALFLNNPNNPTGSIYSKDELIALGDICVEYNVVIIADEIYEKLVYDGAKHYSIAALKPEYKDITVIINGVSKAYAMTGWRLGYSVGPQEIISQGIVTDVELCTYLLDEFKIAVVPGSAFGNKVLTRFSYANSIDNLREGVKRFELGLKSLLT
ncbi:MAG: hypothetical protein B6226_00635 [Candidatus Cloacimonetes bacterium 4572_65]|nr:MAG: hypothetical protein B6226_00635 [Candidatus Cloacimonetes bacterium 4572_65]